ncbi:MAG: MgtC/SapB family protein [Chthoniobacterales bacterium]
MPYIIGWPEIALRLLLTVAAGALLGLNRSEHGHAAGLRTTLLVCLAASVSMLQVNLLLPVSGKTAQSFAVLDLMRLPLGILSGMGFIGAGAILRKGNLVRGLTTAATLWFGTTLGLCFGGGQLILGSSVLIIGFVVLDGLKWVEKRRKQDRRATLTIAINESGPTEDTVTQLLKEAGYEIGPWALSYVKSVSQRELRAEVRWRAHPEDVRPPTFLQTIIHQDGVIKVEWNP